MKKLDDAEIYRLDFEDPQTPESASTTHIGIFLARALLGTEITGAAFLNRYCGSRLIHPQALRRACFAGRAGTLRSATPRPG